MRASMGEAVDLDGDIADVPFAELGYDSLAVLELAGQVKRKYQVTIADDAMLELPTPQTVVEFVNKSFAEVGN
jgi:act minimal PKS acyl carrier protein